MKTCVQLNVNYCVLSNNPKVGSGNKCMPINDRVERLVLHSLMLDLITRMSGKFWLFFSFFFRILRSRFEWIVLGDKNPFCDESCGKHINANAYNVLVISHFASNQLNRLMVVRYTDMRIIPIADTLIRQLPIVMLLIANHNGYWIFPQFENWLHDGDELLELGLLRAENGEEWEIFLASKFNYHIIGIYASRQRRQRSSTMWTYCDRVKSWIIAHWHDFYCDLMSCNFKLLFNGLATWFDEAMQVNPLKLLLVSRWAISDSIYHGTTSFCDGEFYKIYLVGT